MFQVAGVIGRADVLAGLFYIGSILSYRKASCSSSLGKTVHWPLSLVPSIRILTRVHFTSMNTTLTYVCIR